MSTDSNAPTIPKAVCWRCRAPLEPPAYRCARCNSGLRPAEPPLSEAEFVERYRDGALDE